jgi:hypothetical protein
MTHRAYRFQADVQAGGKIELTVPLPAGSRVEVVVLTEEDEFADLRAAAASSMDFWDNPQDDAAWGRGEPA